jgi:hypothetical protein
MASLRFDPATQRDAALDIDREGRAFAEGEIVDEVREGLRARILPGWDHAVTGGLERRRVVPTGPPPSVRGFWGPCLLPHHVEVGLGGRPRQRVEPGSSSFQPLFHDPPSRIWRPMFNASIASRILADAREPAFTGRKPIEPTSSRTTSRAPSSSPANRIRPAKRGSAETPPSGREGGRDDHLALRGSRCRAWQRGR